MTLNITILHLFNKKIWVCLGLNFINMQQKRLILITYCSIKVTQLTEFPFDVMIYNLHWNDIKCIGIRELKSFSSYWSTDVNRSKNKICMDLFLFCMIWTHHTIHFHFNWYSIVCATTDRPKLLSVIFDLYSIRLAYINVTKFHLNN